VKWVVAEEPVVDRLVLPKAIVDFRREEVRCPDGTRIDLRSRAFAVLRCLATHAGQVVSKDELLAECWPDVIVTEDSLTQSILAIRQALGVGARDVVRTVPRRGYMLMPPIQFADSTQDARSLELHLPYVWPGIAVLPFDDFGGGVGPLGASIAAEVTMELARNRDLQVLARHASFAAAAQKLMPGNIAHAFRIRYVLEGNVRLAGERIVVNVQLIDGRHSCHIWAEPFTVLPGDASLSLQRQAALIAARVFSVIREAETFATLHRAAEELSPLELIQRGFAAIKSLERTRFVGGRADLQRVIEIDPDNLIARRLLAALNAKDIGLNITGTLQAEGLFDAIETYEQTLASVRPSALDYQGLGYLLCLTDRKDEALAAAKKSLELGPGDTDTIALLAYVTIEACDYEAALSHIRRAIALSPSKSIFYENLAAYALMGLGRHDACLNYALEATRRTPGNTVAHINVAHALSALGRKREAAARIAELQERSPGYTIQTPVTQMSFLRDRKVRKGYLGRLRDAGLPEGA
jgi:DNA-binding winged helix-turn-helix (wHTH) protein/tetratricopeptide (TPR) repeat protein